MNVPMEHLFRTAVTYTLASFAALSSTLSIAGQVCDPFVTQIDSSIDYDRDIKPIFDTHCAGCHSQQSSFGGLSLEGIDAHGQLVERPSSQDPLLARVSQFEPAFSLLWLKVQCAQPPVGSAMPPGGPQLSLSERRKLFSWISRGAPAGIEGSTASIELIPQVAGSWHDPSASGQGFVFEVLPTEPRQLAIFWLTFSDAPLLVDGDRQLELEKRWYVGIGSSVEGEYFVDVELFKSEGGLLDNANLVSRSSAVGSARIHFHSCNSASVNYVLQLDPEGDAGLVVSRSVALRRLMASSSCVEQAE